MVEKKEMSVCFVGWVFLLSLNDDVCKVGNYYTRNRVAFD